MTIEKLFHNLKHYSESGKVAIIDGSHESTYTDLVNKILYYRKLLSNEYKEAYSIIMHGDYGLDSIAFMWAALLERRILVPITTSLLPQQTIVNIVDADLEVWIDNSVFLKHENNKKKNIINKLFESNSPGLVLMSSGTTGLAKAVLHNANMLLQKFLYSKKQYITLALMLFDHIAGIDTMFYVISSGGTLVVSQDRGSDTIIRILKQHNVEVFPASPSMIHFMLMDDRFNSNYLLDLKIITFGSERAPDDLCKRLEKRFGASVELIQKYGITELGNPATITNKEDPRFIKFKPGSIEYKVEDGVLHIKSESSMLGYLYEEHETSFNGWYNTGDKVEQVGEWIRILGRETDIINVGGQKVYPAEVESIIMQIDGVIDVVVYGKKNALMGSVVAVKVHLQDGEDLQAFKNKMRKHCNSKIETYKIPVVVERLDKIELSARMKKVRI